MDKVAPAVFMANVMHKRLFPAVNQFTYGIYYLALPLSQLGKHLPVAINRSGLLSFYEKDHGARDGSSLQSWIQDILSHNSISDIENIVLVSMPRVLGYVFNPVSFWLCLDNKGELRAVLSEVNNTFGETHSYLCLPTEGDIITQDDWMTADKLFHVSPFLERQGYYKFRFSYQNNKLGVWINYYNEEKQKQLETSLVGTLVPMTKQSLRYAFFRHPLVTLKAVALIHLQAIKLIIKKVRYIRKPEQKAIRLSTNKPQKG